MIVCENPVMRDHKDKTKCYWGKECCCRHCDNKIGCLPGKFQKGSQLCPYIRNEEDFEVECPFEKKIDRRRK